MNYFHISMVCDSGPS